MKNTMNQKGFVNIILVAVVVVLVGAVGYFMFVKKSEPIAQQPTPTQTKTSMSPTPTPTSQATNFKTYTNSQYGFEFQYNPNWSIAPINTGSVYNASKPYVLLWAGSVSDALCQDLGCPPKSGDRDELTKGDTFEGAPPLNPWFKILRVRGDKWVSIQVTDVNKSCSSEATCQQYLSVALLAQKVKVSIAGYQTYNNFIDLLDTFKFTK